MMEEWLRSIEWRASCSVMEFMRRPAMLRRMGARSLTNYPPRRRSLKRASWLWEPTAGGRSANSFSGAIRNRFSALPIAPYYWLTDHSKRGHAPQFSAGKQREGDDQSRARENCQRDHARRGEPAGRKRRSIACFEKIVRRRCNQDGRRYGRVWHPCSRALGEVEDERVDVGDTYDGGQRINARNAKPGCYPTR